MKNVLRIAAVVLPLVCGANIAMTQAILEDAIVTGSEDNAVPRPAAARGPCQHPRR